MGGDTPHPPTNYCPGPLINGPPGPILFNTSTRGRGHGPGPLINGPDPTTRGTAGDFHAPGAFGFATACTFPIPGTLPPPFTGTDFARPAPEGCPDLNGAGDFRTDPTRPPAGTLPTISTSQKKKQHHTQQTTKTTEEQQRTTTNTTTTSYSSPATTNQPPNHAEHPSKQHPRA